MKTSTKCVIGLTAAAGLAFLGYKIYTQFKKERKAVLKKSEELDKQIEEIGVSPTKFKEELIEIEDNKNLVKALYTAIRFNPNWDLAIVEGDLEDDGNGRKFRNILTAPNPVYISQRSVAGENFLDFSFEIPYLGNYVDENNSLDFKKGNKKSMIRNLYPRISDYKNAINDIADKICESVKFVENPFTKLHIYVVAHFYSTDENGVRHREQNIIDMPDEAFDDWRTDKHSGMAAFMTDWFDDNEVAVSHIENIIKDWCESRELEYIEIFDVFMTYLVSFRMADINLQGNPQNYGMNLKMGLDALRLITENLEVYRDYHFNDTESDREKKVSKSRLTIYDRLIFTCPEPETGNWNFLRYYTCNPTTKNVEIGYITY